MEREFDDAPAHGANLDVFKNSGNRSPLVVRMRRQEVRNRRVD